MVENSKRSLMTKEEHDDLASWMHMEILRHIVTAKRWDINELVFHGGTSLRLGYDSPRHSEDLDFMVNNDVRVDRLMDRVHKSIAAVVLKNFGDKAKFRIKARDASKNPLTFTFTIEIPERLGAVKVKTEFWRTDALNQYETEARKLQQSPKRVSKISLSVMPVKFQLPTHNQIYSDKVFAVINREYMKFRDLYDLYWLKTHTDAGSDISGMYKDLVSLRSIYPGSAEASEWVALLDDRLKLWKSPEFPEMFYNDLQKWLPPEVSSYYEKMFFVDAANQLVSDFQKIRDQIEELNVSNGIDNVQHTRRSVSESVIEEGLMVE